MRTRRGATWSSSSSRRGKISANGAGALLRSVREDVGKEEEQSEKDIQSEKEAGEGADHVCVDSNGRLRKDMEEWEVKVKEEENKEDKDMDKDKEDKCVFCKCHQHVTCKLRKCQQAKGGTK